MMYRALGRFSIGPEDKGQPIRSRLAQAVFALLLLNANHVVATRDLLERVWGSSDTDEVQLQKQVYAIRMVLDGIGRRHDLVTHPGVGYELRVDPDDLDIFIFDRCLREAQAAQAAGDIHSERRHLRTAVDLWDGQRILGGAAENALRGAGIAKETRRRQAAVRLAEIDLDFGDAAQVVSDLQILAGYYPTDRRLCELLMIALYRDGSGLVPVESVFRMHKAALAEESGLGPDQELKDLVWAIRRRDQDYIDNRATTGLRVVPHQLPPGPADFIGRDKQVGELRWLLTREPSSTPSALVIAGAGGTGKTALALHVAHLVRSRFPDGQIFLDLGSNTDCPVEPAALLAWILRAIGVAQVPGSVAERRAEYRSRMAGRRVLVVLDDAWNETQIADLIPGDPSSKVLITTRSRLANLPGSVHQLPELRPLETSSAVELFERVVERTGVLHRLDPATTVRVAKVCAGLPLAIVVAAAIYSRNPVRSITDFADLLAKQPIERLQYADRSVAQTIGVGVDRLPSSARRLFVGLGLLRFRDFGRWTAAAVLTDTGEDPDEALDALVACHLLQAGTTGRYRFHDLTHQYARSLAEKEYGIPQRSVTQERVYGTLLTLNRRAYRAIYGGDFEVIYSDVQDRPIALDMVKTVDTDCFRWFESERMNLRAAVEHTAVLGLTALCWDLAITSHEFFNVRGYLDDWFATQVCALRAARAAGDVRGEAAMLTSLGQSAIVASRREGVSQADDVAAAVALFESADDRHGLAMALRTLANFRRREGRLTEAIALFRRSMDVYCEVGDAVGRWQALRYVGQCHLEVRDYDSALRDLERAASLADELGRLRLRAQNAYWLGRVHLARGDLNEADRQFQFVLDSVGRDDPIGRAHALHGKGDLAMLRDNVEVARQLLMDAAAAVREAGGDAVLEGRIHQSMAAVCIAEHDPVGRAEALRSAVACFEAGQADYLRNRAAEALAGGFHVDGNAPESVW